MTAGVRIRPTTVGLLAAEAALAGAVLFGCPGGTENDRSTQCGDEPALRHGGHAGRDLNGNCSKNEMALSAETGPMSPAPAGISAVSTAGIAGLGW